MQDGARVPRGEVRETSSSDVERQRHGARVWTFVDGLEVVHFERAADLVAGAILQDRQREQIVVA